MLFVGIKQTSHPILDPWRHIPYSRMRGPVLSSVLSQREALDAVTVNPIVQSEENTKTCLRKNRMRSLEANVIARDISDGFHKPLFCQEFLDRKMRKLNDPRIAVLDYHDQT